jgi:hypothetical protein
MLSNLLFTIIRNQDRSVGIATGYSLDGRVSISDSATHIASYPVGTAAPFPEAKAAVS